MDLIPISGKGHETLLTVKTQSQFESLLAGFAEEHASPLTKTAYRHSCQEFFSFLGQEVSEDGGIFKKHVTKYIGILRERGMKQATINKKLSGLSSFCNYLKENHQLSQNPVELIGKKVRKRAKDTPPTATLKGHEVRAIFAALDPKKHNFQYHRAVLGVGFYTGLRSSEIRHLRFGDFVQDGGVFVVTTCTKGGDEHTIPVHPVLKTYLDEYFADLEKRGVDTGDPEQYVFTSARKGCEQTPLSDVGLAYIFKTALDRAGIEREGKKRYSPHSMRRSMGNHMEEKDVPLFRIQEVYGHASADTTVGYLDRNKGHEHSGIWQIRY